MKKKAVVIYGREARVGTLLIAKGFGRRHTHVTRIVQKYKPEFEIFCPLKSQKIHGKGRAINEYLLNEEQFLFLGTLFKNSDIVVRFKHRLVREFSKARRQLLAAKAQQSDQKWIMSRDFGKEQRLELTDAIQEFVEYAKDQGSSNADWYYTSITRMTYGLLFILDGKYQNARNLLTAQQFVTLASAERILTKGLRDGMKAKTFYKDIYKTIKQNTLDFAATGQSHVIEEQLKLEEKHEAPI
jgi:phage regulator Rha-like protein